MQLFAGTACMFNSPNKMGDAMFVELPRVRLDGGARVFRQHWGYESTRTLAPPPPLIEEDEGGIEPETVSLREANTASPIERPDASFAEYMHEPEEPIIVAHQTDMSRCHFLEPNLGVPRSGAILVLLFSVALTITANRCR
uniref:Uncharacterized protein n=1 Tax=Trichogramma kaykai TaxID=54128 RepID=A0ABD2WW40_9HYME